MKTKKKQTTWYGPAAYKLALSLYDRLASEGSLRTISGNRHRVWRGSYAELAREMEVSRQYFHRVMRLLLAHGACVTATQGNKWMSNEVIVMERPTQDELVATADEVLGQGSNLIESNLDARIKITERQLKALRSLRGRGRPRKTAEGKRTRKAAAS